MSKQYDLSQFQIKGNSSTSQGESKSYDLSKFQTSPTQSPQLTDLPQVSNDEYTGQNPTASFAKNAVAGFVGGLPDIGVTAHNLVASEENQWPYVTDMVSNAIDKATGGYTKDTGAINKNAARFLFSLFGGGAIGKGVQAAGAAAKGVGGASQAIGKGVEKTGSFISNYLGVTSPSTKNVAAGLAGGAAVGASENAQLPAYAEIPAVIGAYILGGGVGSKTANLIKGQLKPLYEQIPGLEQYLLKQNYEDIAKNIKPEALGDLLKNSIVDKEIGFLTEKTVAELPQEIQVKLKENPALLNEQEVNTVVEKGMSDFTSYFQNLEKEYGIPFTTGEFTGSPKIVAKEDALANKANIEQFDVATKDRKLKIVQRIEKLKNDLSKESQSAEKLGEKIDKEVLGIYGEANKFRSDNWIRRFGKASEEPILPLDDYVDKLKDFSKLNPDTEGNKVAIKLAKERLAALEKEGIKLTIDNDLLLKRTPSNNYSFISPKRFNAILVGLTEDINRFPHKSFSQIQANELKSALDSSLDKAVQQAKTAEQASIIKEARSGWAADSQIIDEIDESVLFSKVNKETLQVPEKVAKALDGMPASQLKLTFNALSRSPNYQEVIPQIQRYYIEQAANAATKSGADTFNPRVFLEKLPKKEEFDIIFGESDAYKQVKDISVMLKRISKFQPTRGNSKTAQRLEGESFDKAGKVISNAAKGNVGESLSNLLGFFKKGSKFDEITADILISPKHRANVLGNLKQANKHPNFAASVQAFKEARK